MASPQEGIARLEPDGSADVTFDTRLVNNGGRPWVLTIVLQPDGKMIIVEVLQGKFRLLSTSDQRYSPVGPSNSWLFDSISAFRLPFRGSIYSTRASGGGQKRILF
jgi:hypothetical protein